MRDEALNGAEAENKSSMYSPVKADRWSCGRVLLCLLDEFLKEERLMRVIGRELRAHGPKRRSSLFEWESWPNVASVRETGKGKASRPVDDTAEKTWSPRRRRSRSSVVGARRERRCPQSFVRQELQMGV